MTIYWVDNPNEQISKVPHQTQFQQWKSRLDQSHIAAIHAEFDKMISNREASQNKILTSNWLPSELCQEGGMEWGGTPFWPIYEDACNKSIQQAGWCFGLLLWEYMMNRDDEWICGKFDMDGVPIGGTTYFEKSY